MIFSLIDNLLKIFFAYILADFLVGVLHWIKDTYFSPHTPIIGNIFIWPSRLHHIKPRHIVEQSDIELFKSSALWTLTWMGPLFLYIGISVFTASLFFTISINDIVHKYAHLIDSERPAFITFLQKIQIFQSHNQHHLHHINPFEINYCPITPFTNMYLEKINFWRNLENLIENITGIKPRATIDNFIEDDTAIAGITFLSAD